VSGIVTRDTVAMAEDRRLLLLRHAKSSWDDPALADHDRPLAARGRRAATAIGEYLRRERVEIALVLCSSARRARETVDLVAPSGEIRLERELYGASADGLLERVRRVSDTCGVVMLVGHQPAMQDLTLDLVGDAGELAGRKFPTGALAVLGVTGGWGALRSGGAQLDAFIRPRELS